jgi:hypothetical protein
MNSNNNLVFESQDTEPWLNACINSNNLYKSDEDSDKLQLQHDFAEEIDTYLEKKGYDLDTDESVCTEYAKYIRMTARSSFRHDGYSTDGLVTKKSEGSYRHKDGYRKQIWTKLNCLDDWYAANPTEITMATFTVYQKDLEMWEMLEMLKSGFNKAKQILNKYLGHFSYIWALDYQQTGAPHIHMIIFRDVPEQLQDKVRNLWEFRYNPGASISGHRYEDSLQFETSSGEKHLKSAVAYAFSYVGKSLKHDSKENPASFLLSAWLWKMGNRDSEYNSVRIWDSSSDLKQVMALTDSSDINWWRCSVNVPASDKTKGGWLTLWESEDMDGHSDIIKEFDDSLAELDQDSLKSCKDVIVIKQSCNKAG